LNKEHSLTAPPAATLHTGKNPEFSRVGRIIGWNILYLLSLENASENDNSLPCMVIYWHFPMYFSNQENLKRSNKVFERL
jgi:hypothetical protein